MRIHNSLTALAFVVLSSCAGGGSAPAPEGVREIPGNTTDDSAPAQPPASPPTVATPQETRPPASDNPPNTDAGLTESDAVALPVDSAPPPTPVDPVAPLPSSPAADAAPSPAPSPPAGVTTEYAPYFYTWGWENSAYRFTSLVGMHKQTAVPAVTLAFVLANGGCSPTRSIQSHAADIVAYKALGGQVKASFGGAGGTYLENGCTDAPSLASAITAFVDETGIKDLDFDVEQSVAMNPTANARRSTALATVQASRGIKISFTLPAMPSGLTPEATAVVGSAVAAGIAISHVNLMVMDYGSSVSAGRKMSDLAIASVDACAAQLKTILPTLSDAAAYAMIGATPMIGQNDVAGEVFTLADATALVAFAKAKRLGLVSFWALQRDEVCRGAVDLALCTGAQTASNQFHNILKTVR